MFQSTCIMPIVSCCIVLRERLPMVTTVLSRCLLLQVFVLVISYSMRYRVTTGKWSQYLSHSSTTGYSDVHVCMVRTQSSHNNMWIWDFTRPSWTAIWCYRLLAHPCLKIWGHEEEQTSFLFLFQIKTIRTVQNILQFRSYTVLCIYLAPHFLKLCLNVCLMGLLCLRISKL